MPVSFQFDCVYYYVSEMGRAVRFYTDVLGFKFVSQDVVTRFDVDGVLFELVPASSRKQLEGAGNARLALRVEDIAVALEQLRAHGVEVSQAENKGPGWLAFLRDPDGNEICLWQYASTN